MITPLNNSNKFMKQSVKIVKFNPEKLVESIKKELKDNMLSIDLSKYTKLIMIEFHQNIAGWKLKYLMDLTNSLNELYIELGFRSFITSSSNYNLCFNIGWEF